MSATHLSSIGLDDFVEYLTFDQSRLLYSSVADVSVRYIPLSIVGPVDSSRAERTGPANTRYSHRQGHAGTTPPEAAAHATALTETRLQYGGTPRLAVTGTNSPPLSEHRIPLYR
ncbi:uncharacterized protein CANTADRAFT_215910 [Suhomyces tanzawaensis NRRL Y-17324]|uniref:Uncharacterized protein n=1 Tax=Suhomyces tanzawaensis NRRL Y-17324 TaxID=984487 RepID=A0A1E4SJV3_9ASCO|nr:uncharacterized protein CANTADRAFT_215910 [Suhomyces tanzawaensis NRRL Y-17324]ODV79770.1 hypothetical protein CANTADRAFT_216128 [Suhomyces tanzawaensis NRRL Y-17324]